jgi:transposase
MRKITEILRLHFELGLSNRAIGRSVGASASTISDCLARAKAAGFGWPLDPTVTESILEDRLFPPPGNAPEGRAEPDCAYLRHELAKHRHLTLMLLWQEYKQNHPADGYQYSQFCDIYRRYREQLDVELRQEHRAGEKTFVDFSGDGICITDPNTGEIREAPLFVAALGASSYTHAEAFEDQKEHHWIEGHIHAFEFFNGVTELVIQDNTKTAVITPCRYDPELNRAYRDMLRHYRTAALPARKFKPKDKAKVESAVLLAQRWILAALRNHTFFSLAEANQAIAAKLVELNQRKFQKLPSSRRELYETLDRPALKALPATRYEYAEWTTHTVNVDYHVEVAGHLYSVPWALHGKKVEARLTQTTVEVFFRGERVAAHPRSFVKHRATTLKDHMPEHHRQVVEWNPDRIRAWVGQAGGAAAKLAEAIMASKPHPELGYRACLGLVRLGEKYGPARLEAACARALLIGARSYQSVKSILKSGLDRQLTLHEDPEPRAPGDHENIRGPNYYQ